MSTRRTRATSRRSESRELLEAPFTRQTRSSSKRFERMQSDIPQRGTRRRRRRSLESIATNDFPSSAPRQTSPEREPSPERRMPLAGISESENAEVMADEAPTTVNTDSQNDSYEDKVARLRDLLDFDLPKLQRWCERAYEVLSTLTQSEPTAEVRRNLNAIQKSFKAARRPLVEDGAVYTDLSSFDLPYRDDPSDCATVHRATHSANLVSLLLSLVDVRSSRKALLPFLQELDDAFAAFVDLNLPPRLESNDLALRIRCYRLVELLREESDAEQLVLASAIFCTEPASTSEEARQRMSQGPFRRCGGMEQGGDFTTSNEFKTQVDDIITTLSLPESAGKEELLNAAFPKGELLNKLWTWALSTYLHVNKMADEGDVPPNGQEEGESNKGSARDEPEGLLSGTHNQPAEEPNDLAQDEPEGFLISDNDQPEEEEASDSDSSSGLEYNQLQTRTIEKSFIQDRVTLDAVRRSERDGSKRLTTEQPFDQQSIRGRRSESGIGDAIRGLDAADILNAPNPYHANGSRTATPGAGHLPPPTRHRSRSAPKRPREDEDYHDDYGDEDDDFEVNEQLVDESMRVWQDSPRVVRNRSRFSGNFRQPRGGPSSRDVSLTGAGAREKDLARLSQVARVNRMANKGRPRQTRERWSDADTDRLLDLIANESLNCSWAAIEKKGGFQTPRNQQAIRDKARNLKKGYLCTDAILPSGFDQVYLGKKERDEVIASGRNPDRMEDDIDEDGHVINSLWVEESS